MKISNFLIAYKKGKKLLEKRTKKSTKFALKLINFDCSSPWLERVKRSKIFLSLLRVLYCLDHFDDSNNDCLTAIVKQTVKRKEMKTGKIIRKSRLQQRGRKGKINQKTAKNQWFASLQGSCSLSLFLPFFGAISYAHPASARAL